MEDMAVTIDPKPDNSGNKPSEAHEALEELTPDLEGEIKARYAYGNEAFHPAMGHKYVRDMGPVNKGKKAIYTTGPLAKLAREGKQP